ncbi:MAG TPA: 6-phosphogluconolactonase [Solirubrobacteraceae bacterium]|jgi:6-phosphogluconolactonase|nr:6-phosphogluconolactonase [Solirubrobacteraceae bacterium]
MSAEPIPTETLSDDMSVALRAAEIVVEHAHAAIAARRMFTLAVSGGHTPGQMFAVLARRNDFPWDQSAIYQVDERIAPGGDPNRNLTLLWDNLPEAAFSQLHPMPVQADDLDEAAARYASALPERFDLIHLGIGADGHTASLVPGDPVLDVRDRDVALTGLYMGLPRMTFTYPVLNRARALLWLITGKEKREALSRLQAHDESIPAGQVASERAQIIADAAAAGR